MSNAEHEYRVISNKLPIGGLIFAIIVILGVLLVKQPSKKYRTTTEDMLTELLMHKYVVTPEKVMDILYNNDSIYQFIDLRSSHDFIKGHLNNAINIPIHRIFDEEFEEVLNQDNHINVLYYSDHCGACGPWMILEQIGYKNNMILLGGYDYVNDYIIKQYSPMTGNFRNEKPKYDYAKIVSETAGVGSVGSQTTSVGSSKKAPTKKKKKKKEQEGGC